MYIVQSLLGHQLIFIRSQAGFLIYLSLHTLGCMYDVSRARWDGPSIVCVRMVALGVSLKTKRIRVHFFSPHFCSFLTHAHIVQMTAHFLFWEHFYSAPSTVEKEKIQEKK